MDDQELGLFQPMITRCLAQEVAPFYQQWEEAADASHHKHIAPHAAAHRHALNSSGGGRLEDGMAMVRRPLQAQDHTGRTQDITVWDEYAFGRHCNWEPGKTYIFENLERELKTHGSTTTPQYNAWYDCFVTKVSPPGDRAGDRVSGKRSARHELKHAVQVSV